MEQPGEVRLDQGVPAPGIRLLERLAKGATDDVDQHIARGAEPGVDVGEEGGERVGVPSVEFVRHHLTAGFGDERRRLAQRRAVAITQGESHSGPGEIDGTGASQTSSPTDDDGHAALQIGPVVEIAHNDSPLLMVGVYSWSVLTVVGAYSWSFIPFRAA